MNWIEKAAEECINAVGSNRQNVIEAIGENTFADIILKHAPVIDAEKIAKKVCHQHNEWEQEEMQGRCLTQAEHYRLTAKIITDNIELDITWVDGKAEWGEFTLVVEEPVLGTDNKYWLWKLRCVSVEHTVKMEPAKTQELAVQACETALKKILAGVKDVG